MPSQILPGQKTVANLLQDAGYHTAMFGKQGFGGEHAKLADGNPDFTKPMLEGPRAWGFDYSAIIPRASGSAAAVPGQRTARSRRGQAHPGPDRSARRVRGLLGARLGPQPGRPGCWTTPRSSWTCTIRERKDSPFFMHFCTDGGHAPYVPAEAIRGTALKGQTKMTEHTDMVLEPDILLGHLMAMLDSAACSRTPSSVSPATTAACPTSATSGTTRSAGCAGRRVSSLKAAIACRCWSAGPARSRRAASATSSSVSMTSRPRWSNWPVLGCPATNASTR